MGRDIKESHSTEYKSGFGSECANNVLACMWILTLHTFASRGQ